MPPTGGLSMYGAGLQLQQATPGVANTGNAHMTGTLIADNQIYSETPNRKLLKYGRNPGQNYGALWRTALSMLVGSDNEITDSNIIQASCFVGVVNTIGNGARVGITHWSVFGNNNTLCTSGANYGSTGAVIVGNSNQSNFDGAHDGQNNSMPIIIGYGNQWNGVKGTNPYSHGVLIDHGAVVQSGLDNVIMIHGNRDGEITTSNTIKIGNRFQTTINIGSLSLTKRTVTGAKAGNAALASLLTELAAMGLITDSTTA